MRIGFYLANRQIPDVDLRYPRLGNPGCGGTEFLFSALPHYLAKLHGHALCPIIFANHVDFLPDNVSAIRVEDVCDGAYAAKEEGCSFFIYRPHRHVDSRILDLINELQLPAIGWLHLTPTMPHLRRMANTPYLKAIVCVEHEQYDLIQDSPAYEKLTYIVNGFDVDGFQPSSRPKKDPCLVAYLGAIVPQKGFHLLAKIWKKVLNRCPQARLVVIGTGALYDSGSRLGPWGIASEIYEEKHIVPYLIDEKGDLHPSVCFMGKLGIEKKEILSQALVGIANPTGQTENCPGSALEFQACGTAVVSGAFYGLLDTVQQGKTGLLGRTEGALVENICRLLEDPIQAQKMGEVGLKFVRERYEFTKVAGEWIALFERLSSGEKPKGKPFKKNFHRHAKWLIVINRQLQIWLGTFMNWPSVLELKEVAVKGLCKWKKI